MVDCVLLEEGKDLNLESFNKLIQRLGGEQEGSRSKF
jgi:hypothetical protein